MTERRFRASVYIDVWVPETEDLEKDRLEAIRIADEFASLRPNSLVGGVALFTTNPLPKLDKEI